MSTGRCAGEVLLVLKGVIRRVFFAGVRSARGKSGALGPRPTYAIFDAVEEPMSVSPAKQLTNSSTSARASFDRRPCRYGERATFRNLCAMSVTPTDQRFRASSCNRPELNKASHIDPPGGLIGLLPLTHAAISASPGRCGVRAVTADDGPLPNLRTGRAPVRYRCAS